MFLPNANKLINQYFLYNIRFADKNNCSLFMIRILEKDGSGKKIAVLIRINEKPNLEIVQLLSLHKS